MNTARCGTLLLFFVLILFPARFLQAQKKDKKLEAQIALLLQGFNG